MTTVKIIALSITFQFCHLQCKPSFEGRLGDSALGLTNNISINSLVEAGDCAL